MSKFVNFFFSQFAWFVLAGIYLISAGISFCVEYFVGGTDFWSTIFLRGSTVILDILFIGLGIYAITKRWLKKRFLRREIFRKNIFWVFYLAETLAIFLLFYIPYVIRVIYLFFDNKISTKTLLIDLGIGIFAVIVLGYFIKKFIGRLKKMGKKFQDSYNGKS